MKSDLVSYICVGSVPVLMAAALAYAIFAGMTVEVRPGQVMACYRQGSRTVERIYKTPGRHRRPRPQQGWALSWFQFWANQPVFIESRPVEAVTSDGRPIFLTTRLTMSLADPTHPEPYIEAVIGEALKRWREEALPPIITRAAAGYTFDDALRNRDRIAEDIASALKSWKATPSFGLIFQGAVIVQATSPRVPKD